MSFDIRRAIRNRLAFLQGMWVVISRLPQGVRGLQSAAEELERRAHEGLESTKIEEEDLLFQMVGQALTTWAHMEETLVLTLALLLRMNGKRAGVLLYSIVNFNTWLSIIHDQFELDPDLNSFQKRWNKISERIKKVKDRRDKIAHHAVGIKAPALTPSELDVRPKSLLQQPMNVRDALELSKAVNAITKDIGALVSDMHAALRALNEKSAPQESGH
jgi:hypothetical protein